MSEQTTDLLNYRQQLDAAPKSEVTATEFKRRAVKAGWEPRTITLFLLPPLLTTKYVLCNGEGLKVKE